MIDNKAAIWARVSTEGQKETSLPSQVSRCREKLTAEGYQVIPEYTFAVDWTSLELNNCPEYLRLLSLIMARNIQAVGIYNRDRLPANFDERLLFLSECRKAGVKVIPCEGSPVENTDEAMLIEHVLSLGKKQQVLRAQIGSKQGLHDRITKYRKPATFRPIYGYRWLKKELTLVPDENLANVKLIIGWLLEGWSYDRIIKELHQQGIPSPSKLKTWNKHSISYILHNPVYAGRYYGLKKTAVEPQKRRNEKSYGRTSCHVKTLEESEYLPEVKVLECVISWDQRELLIEQAQKRQWLSKRNANYDYLLRGLIQCGEHTGVNGKPRVYHGKPYHDKHAYVCPVGKCYRPLVSGPEIDNFIKQYVTIMISNLPDLVKTTNSENTKQSLKTEIDILQKKADLIIIKQVRTTDDFYNGNISAEVYDSLKSTYNFELEGNKNQRNVLLDKINALNEQSKAVESAESIRLKYFGILQADIEKVFKLPFETPNTQYKNVMDNEKWRELFGTLNLKITVLTAEQRKEKIKSSFNNFEHPFDELEFQRMVDNKNFSLMTDIDISTAVSLNVSSVMGSIASHEAWNGLHNKRVYPVSLSMV